MGRNHGEMGEIALGHFGNKFQPVYLDRQRCQSCAFSSAALRHTKVSVYRPGSWVVTEDSEH